ncbi:MAG: S8 family serine peptidase, partial [Spirochaetota bacterium]
MAQKSELKKRSNISARVTALMQMMDNDPHSTVAAIAKGKTGFISEGEKLVLYAEAAGTLEQAVRSLRDRNADIRYTYGSTIEFRIAAADIAGLSTVSGIRMIREPDTPVLHVIEGEEVTNTKATNAHRSGNRGAGIKVAVIDGGFIGLSAAQAAGEVPAATAVDFTGAGIETSTTHGTAVAEVVHEMAPAAQLYLLKISTSVQLGSAKDYCIANGINIINHSMGWVNSGWGNGDGTVCTIANNAYANGILWVNSAGNSAERHWQGMYSDPNANSVHNFSGSFETNYIGFLSAGTAVGLYLCWNDPWSGSANDYDLYLIRRNGGAWNMISGASEGVQSGSQSPTESISGGVPVSDDYAVLIARYSGAARELQLFSFYQKYGYSNVSKSLMAPSDASGALAVGAISFARWTTGPTAIYSSQGPTQDGRRKPEIAGVDSNANWTYGNFTGTSSASPCVAGAAAVLWGAYLGYYNNALTWKHLTNDAIDMGVAGIDDEYGYGRMNITIPVKGAPTTPVPDLQYSPSTNIGFTWTKGGISNSANAYTIEISTNTIDTFIMTNLASGVSLPFTTTITFPYTYYARVRGSNEFGLGPWSTWSATGSLVDISPPVYAAVSGTPTATNSIIYDLGVSGTNDIGSGIDRIGMIVTNGTAPVILPYQNPISGVLLPEFTTALTNVGIFLIDRAGNSSTTQFRSVGCIDTIAPTITCPARAVDIRVAHRFTAAD